jgi:hypothetical protein
MYEDEDHNKSYSYMAVLIMMSDIVGVDITSTLEWSQATPQHA